MNVLIDTCIWSMALRRKAPAKTPEREELADLIADHRAQLTGPIRQEILSGVQDEV